MQNNPLVSIIIPTYNRAHLIGETLDSVLSQTYPNWECIIVDDGSIDNTEEVVSAYVQKDSRFQYHHRPDIHKPGGNGARNYGFLQSKGEYINWLDSDDTISKNKIKEQIELVKNKTRSISICRWKRFINNVDEEIIERNYTFFKNFNFPPDIFIELGKSKSFLPSHCFLISKEIVPLSGLWNESLKINQDGEFFTRVILNSSQILFSSQAFAFYRTNSINSTSGFSSKEKATHSLYSWILIETQLLINDIQDSTYVDNSKKYLYNKFKKDYKCLILDNKFFFRKQLIENSFINRLKRKLF